MNHDARELRQAAEEIARSAGELLLGFVGERLDIRLKGDVDLVTQADRASEDLIVGELRRRFPDHEILAEEGGGRRAMPDGRVLWIVDPLDGTTNFAHGLPIWSVSIAAYRDGVGLAGVVHDPSRDECFSAARGEGASLNGRPIRVSTETELGRALLVTGFPYDIRTSPANNLDHFSRFMVRSRAVRRLGSAAIDLAYVAAGRFDAFWEMKLAPWDVAAGALLIREAGGVVTRFDGGPFDVFTDEVVAGPEGLLPPMRSILLEGTRPADAG